MQTAAINISYLSTQNRFALHAVAISLLTLLALTVNVPEIDNYVESIVNARQLKAPHMLPPLQEEYNPGLDPSTPDEDVVIVTDTVKEALKNSGRDIQGMDSLPRSNLNAKTSPRNSWPHEPMRIGLPLNNSSVSRRSSTVSTISGSQIDTIDSCSSSPYPTRKVFSEEVSAKALKNVLMASAKEQTEESERRKMKQDVFIDGQFEDICALLEKPGPNLNEHLSVLFKKLDESPNVKSANAEGEYSVMNDNEPYMKFCPQIFMY